MKPRSNIASAKSQFSRLIGLVKQGQTVLITERNKPVATLQPVSQAFPAGLEVLHASGVLTSPGKTLDVAAFLSAPRASLTVENSLTQAILAEREESR
jgi:prevent-host-death family protein